MKSSISSALNSNHSELGEKYLFSGIFRPVSNERFGYKSSYIRTIYTPEDRETTSKIINNYYNTVLHTDLYDLVKYYENKFNISSKTFNEQWDEGKLPGTPDFFNWKNIHTAIFEK